MKLQIRIILGLAVFALCLGGGLLLLGGALFSWSQSRERAAPQAQPASPAAVAEPPAEGRDFLAACSAGDVKAEFVISHWSGYFQQGAVLRAGSSTNMSLALDNSSHTPLKLSFPGYLYAVPKHPEVSTEAPGAIPVGAYLLILPPKFVKTVAAGQSAKEQILTAWVIRMPLMKPAKSEEILRYSVSCFPAGSSWARLAEQLAGAAPPVDKEFGQKLVRIASADYPEKDAARVFDQTSFRDLCRMEEMLRASGLDLAKFPAFLAAHTRYQALMALLAKAALADETQCAAAVEQAWAAGDFCAGDSAVAQALARFLKLEGNSLRNHLIALLERVGAGDPAVNDALLTCALEDVDLFTRMSAALCLVHLDDGRGVPLLAQFSAQAGADYEIGATKQRCTAGLQAFWKRQGKPVDGAKWNEALRTFGGVDSPDLKAAPAADLAKLRDFIAAGRNLISAVDNLCTVAAKHPDFRARSSALEALDMDARKNAPRIMDVFIDRLRNDPAPKVRVTAIARTRNKKDPRFETALLDDLKTEKDPEVIQMIFYAVAALKSQAAIPLLLPFLERQETRYSANDALTRITGQHCKSQKREDWEQLLKDKPRQP